MDKGFQDRLSDFTVSFFPSGPQQVLWASAFHQQLESNKTGQSSVPFFPPSQPFLLPIPLPSQHQVTPSSFSSSWFCQSFPSSPQRIPSPSTNYSPSSNADQIFELAAAIKKRRLHLGITQVRKIVGKGKCSQSFLFFLFRPNSYQWLSFFVRQGRLCDALGALYQETISQTTLSRSNQKPKITKVST